MKLIPFSKQQIIDRIKFENPWWQTSEIDPYYSKMKKRLYFDLFQPLVNERKIKRAVVLMGPRRVGKTVMLFHSVQNLIEKGVSAKKICYLSIETPIYNNISLEELFQLCREAVGDEEYNDFYVFYDEIQYLKNWEVHLKSLVDSYHHTKFIVSGSAAAALKLKSDESGAGRFTDFTLPPLTFYEYINMKDLEGLITKSTRDLKIDSELYTRNFYESSNIQEFNKHFIDYINYGGYPEVIFSETIKSDPGRYIRNDIIDKVLLRDLPSLYGIQDVQELNSLFTSLAYNTGNEVSLDGLSNSSGVAKNTIKKYLTYLEAAFLIKVVNRIDLNAKKFKRANFFKIYLTNPSLRSALFSPIIESDELIGNLIETAIFSQWQHRNHDMPYYSRWNNGEVDIVGLTTRQKPVWIVEIKWTNRFANDPRKLNNVKVFCRKNNLDRAIVTSIDYMGSKEEDGITYDFIPASLYCYTLGRNTIEGKFKETPIYRKVT